jgi:hypothetical protein
MQRIKLSNPMITKSISFIKTGGLTLALAGALFAVPETAEARSRVYGSVGVQFGSGSYCSPHSHYGSSYGPRYGYTTLPRYIGPSYRYGSCAPRSSVGVTVFSSPSYVVPSYTTTRYVSSPVYSGRVVGSSYSSGLEVDVQRELRRLGYYDGALDGEVGPGTRSGIRAYQRDNGLAVTGMIDRALLRSLGL